MGSARFRLYNLQLPHKVTFYWHKPQSSLRAKIHFKKKYFSQSIIIKKNQSNSQMTSINQLLFVI